MPKTEIGLQRLLAIKEKIKNLNHPNIDIPIIENGEAISNYYPLSFNNLSFNDLELKKIYISICDAVQYLHDNEIYGIDLKPEHILFDLDKNLKLIDAFEPSTICPKWNAPESIFKNIITKQSDIYTFGNIMYYGSHKTLPFDDTKPLKFMHSLLKENPKSNSIFHNVIEKCLEKNPKDRFGSFIEIKTTLMALLQAS